jgi:trans-2,3-dihydro-3-hydroxyanthranilate isomerase
MRTVIVWWDLSESAQTIESLRTYLLDESITAFAEVPGLRFKMWIADPETNRWGAVLLWESAEAAAQPLPSRAAALIGYLPTQSHVFDVEATVEGRYEDAQLALRGLAFAAAAPGADDHRAAAAQVGQP